MPDGSKRPASRRRAIVNNLTLLNIYKAIFQKPVITKFLNVFGPDLELKMFDAPPAPRPRNLSLSGLDVEANAGNVIDGGPYLNERMGMSLGEG